MSDKQQGYGSLLGLPQGITTRDQLQQFKRKDEMEKFQRQMKESSAGMQPGDAMVFNQFATLGKALGDKWMGNKAQLSADEEQGIQTMEDFNARMETVKGGEDWAKMSAEERGFATQDQLVYAMQAKGDQEGALALAADVAKKRREHRIGMAQARKLDAEAATEEASLNSGPDVIGTFNDLYSQKERQNMRTQAVEIDNLTGVVKELSDAMIAAERPADVAGSVGTMQSIGNNLIKTFEGAGRTIKVFAGLDDEGQGIGKGKGIQELANELIDDSWVPEKFRNNAVQANRYKAAIMQMVYADARMNEPGARQLSDADIQNSMVRLGVNSEDPAAVVQVFQNNMLRRLDVAQHEFGAISNTLSNVGGKKALERVLGRDVFTQIDASRESINSSFTAVNEKIVQNDPSAPVPGKADQPTALSQQEDDELTSLGFGS